MGQRLAKICSLCISKRKKRKHVFFSRFVSFFTNYNWDNLLIIQTIFNGWKLFKINSTLPAPFKNHIAIITRCSCYAKCSRVKAIAKTLHLWWQRTNLLWITIFLFSNFSCQHTKSLRVTSKFPKQLAVLLFEWPSSRSWTSRGHGKHDTTVVVVTPSYLIILSSRPESITLRSRPIRTAIELHRPFKCFWSDDMLQTMYTMLVTVIHFKSLQVLTQLFTRVEWPHGVRTFNSSKRLSGHCTLWQTASVVHPARKTYPCCSLKALNTIGNYSK